MAANPIKNQNKSNRGGRRTGAGRPKGAVNKATISIRDAAREHTEQALETLVSVMTCPTEPAGARVSAANAILDRGYGKPSTVLSGDEDGGAIKIEHRSALDLTDDELAAIAAKALAS